MDNERLQDKLRKIKALAEQGVGGEKEGALALYQRLLAKYELTDADVEEDSIELRWFRFSDEIDKKLLTQIFYKVTGNPSFYYKTDKRRNLIGTECTEVESNMIVFYYQFYSETIKNELNKFLAAFFSVNDLFPDETARCYKDTKNMSNKSERSLQEILDIDMMASGMHKKTPNLQIEQKD